MNAKEIEKLTDHFERCFGQKAATVMRNKAETELPIDILVFAPTGRYPFWKLCTRGASDYRMPKREGVRYGETATLQNEYMMFLDPTVRIEEGSDDWLWYWQILTETAMFPFSNRMGVIATDIIDLGREQDTMQGVILLFPEVIEDTSILQCRMGLGRNVTCLQVMPVTKRELERRIDGTDADDDWLYSQFYHHDPMRPDRFIAQRERE
ncbi:suppressor of fused domain protein [Methanomethylophilus alvi]|uniref:suppressor of fused domain protein n=1 Tax=Methanomethylophilus alvi TaxID=1291540 RepID=UPI0037DD178A